MNGGGLDSGGDGRPGAERQFLARLLRNCGNQLKSAVDGDPLDRSVGFNGEHTTGQMIALRFCPDDELPDLSRIVITDKIRDRNEIKKRIKNWRADDGPRA